MLIADLATQGCLSRDEDVLKGMERARHFSYYAVAGGTGEARWTHEVGLSHAHALRLLDCKKGHCIFRYSCNRCIRLNRVTLPVLSLTETDL